MGGGAARTVSTTERDRLRDLLRSRSVRTGDFLLASGARSSWYIDARLTTMSGAGQLLIGRIGLQAIDDAAWSPDAVGGLTLGADPVACAIAHAAARAGRRLDAFTVRKEPKAHGAGRRIEGAFPSFGGRVVIVEDVITTGGSALRAVEAVLADGGIVEGILAIVDRGAGGRENLEGKGYSVTSLFTAADLLEP
jgi:orotate phosphoribosyltransferase